jgi:putative ABC transport system permease protein
MSTRLAPSRLHAGDVLRVGSIGLRTRRLRAVLSALGIAIGIAAMVGVLGLSESSKADLLDQLDQLGTNLLTVAPGQTLGGEDSSLPEEAEAMIGRIGPVQEVASVGAVDATVRRSPYIPEDETGGLAVRPTTTNLLPTLGATVRDGKFLDAASERYPAVVLGSVAAQRLGVTEVDGRRQVWIGDEWFTVIGILDPVQLATGLDRSVMIGYPVAMRELGAERNASTVYVRSATDQVAAVRGVLGRTANPQDPEEVEVSRPSDALVARAAATSAFTSLFLGLGAVALLVGGVGIANVMVISVLERRSEIGLRRALGATRAHVAVQFLSESLLLSAIGGAGGVALGAAVTATYAAIRGWQTVVPAAALAGGLAAALLIGAIAGLYPAMRAARLAPTEALRSV